MKILVDTNVLTRAAQLAHPQHPPALAALKAMKAQGNEPCIVPQVIYEYWAVCTRPIEANGLGMAPPQVEQKVAEIKRLFAFFRDERAIFPEWEKLVVQHQVAGKTAHDARLVAAMIRHGMKHLLTFNAADFARYAGITVFTPDQVLHASP